MMPSPDQLGVFLWGIAERRVTSSFFRFSAECESSFRSLIDKGVAVLLTQEQTPSSTIVMKAQQDVERLLDKMLAYGIEDRRAENMEERRAQSKEDLIMVWNQASQISFLCLETGTL
jgi:predicted ATPase